MKKNLIMVIQQCHYKSIFESNFNLLFKTISSKNTELKIFNNLEEGFKIAESNLNNFERIVFIDDLGIAPFMYFSKIKGLIPASIYDEHSAYMTPFHNNTKILCSGYKITTGNIMFSIIEKFLTTQYEGGRHKVRIDMLDKELENE